MSQELKFWRRDKAKSFFGDDIDHVIALDRSGAVRMYSRSEVVSIDHADRQGVLCRKAASTGYGEVMQWPLFDCLDSVKRGTPVLLITEEPNDKVLLRQVIHSGQSDELQALSLAHSVFRWRKAEEEKDKEMIPSVQKAIMRDQSSFGSMTSNVAINLCAPPPLLFDYGLS